ncbi:MAG: hypothetical protein N7Q72_05915, partial [Spiroplasma sp. Tabriz.8]|nr:hypothetical protein [Spiroplasma sp. Tabriz.8]
GPKNTKTTLELYIHTYIYIYIHTYIYIYIYIYIYQDLKDFTNYPYQRRYTIKEKVNKKKVTLVIEKKWRYYKRP